MTKLNNQNTSLTKVMFCCVLFWYS